MAEGTLFERIIAILSSVLTIVSMDWARFLGVHGIYYAIMVLPPLSLTFFWFQKRQLVQEINEIIEIENDSNRELQVKGLIENSRWKSFWVRRELVNKVRSKSPSLSCKLKSVGCLSDMGEYRVIKYLSDFSESKYEYKIRGAALEGLSKFDHPEVRNIFFRSLRDKDSNIIRLAIIGLQNFPDSDSLERIYPFLCDDNHYIRRNVVESIDSIIFSMKSPDIGLVNHMEKLLEKDKDHDVLEISVDILRGIGGPRCRSVLVAAHDSGRFSPGGELERYPEIKEKINNAIAEIDETKRKNQQ